MILQNINFYSEDANQGDSMWPFFGFCVFLVGIMVVLYGVVNLVSAWREFNIFYDASALQEKPDRKLKKDKMVKYGIITAVGVFMIIVSYLF